MIVVPESMIVSKFVFVFLVPTTALAPVACQNPVDVSTEWYSTEPVYLLVSVPPRNSVEPDDARWNPNTPALTLPSLTAVLKNGFWPRFEIEGYASPSRPSMGSPWNELDSVVTGEKYWPVTVIPATVTA